MAIADDLPTLGDLHLRIWLGGISFDYSVAAAAVGNLIGDWRRMRWYTIEFIFDAMDECLPERRLPNERLFLGL